MYIDLSLSDNEANVEMISAFDNYSVRVSVECGGRLIGCLWGTPDWLLKAPAWIICKFR